MTIARGHLELLRREQRTTLELEVALDELARMERIVERLLFLGSAEQPGFLVLQQIDVEAFLGDVFLRWSGVRRAYLAAERRPRREVCGSIRRRSGSALDAALLENAVKYTNPGDAVELAAHADGTAGS